VHPFTCAIAGGTQLSERKPEAQPGYHEPVGVASDAIAEGEPEIRRDVQRPACTASAEEFDHPSSC